GRAESRGTADAYQVIGRAWLPELAERFEVDPGIGEGPEGRHEGERYPEDEEQDPGRSKGAGPSGQLALRTLGELPGGKGPLPRAGHKDARRTWMGLNKDDGESIRNDKPARL